MFGNPDDIDIDIPDDIVIDIDIPDDTIFSIVIITVIVDVIMITCNSGVDGSDESSNDDPQGEHQVQVSERNQVGNYLKKDTCIAK